MHSSSAMGSTTPSATGTCPSSEPWPRTFTRWAGARAGRRTAGSEARQEGSARYRRGRSSMDVKRYFRGPFVAVLVVLLLFFFLYRYASSGTSYKQVDTSQVISLIDTGKVKSALLIDTDQTIQITTKTGQSLQASWVGNQGQQLATTLQQQHTNYNVQVPRGSSIFALILSWLPFLLIILVFLFLMNQMQGGGSRVMNFGKSKAKLITKDTPKTTFADVAGADEATQELQENKEVLHSPRKIQAHPAQIPQD